MSWGIEIKDFREAPNSIRREQKAAEKRSKPHRGRQPEITWRGESDREKSLSDPGWHRRTTATTTTYQRWTSSSQEISSIPTIIKDAREKLQSSDRPRNFSKIIISDSPISPLEDTNEATLPEGTSSLKGATSATQTTTHLVDSQTQTLQYTKNNQDVETQKDLTVEVNEEYGHCVGIA